MAGIFGIFQIPLYISMFMAVRYMSFSPEIFVNLHQTSFLYLDRITDPDPYFLIPAASAITSFLTIRFVRSVQPKNANMNPMMLKIQVWFQYMPFIAMFILSTYPAILNMYWWSVAVTNLIIMRFFHSKLFKRFKGLDKPFPDTIAYTKYLKRMGITNIQKAEMVKAPAVGKSWDSLDGFDYELL